MHSQLINKIKYGCKVNECYSRNCITFIENSYHQFPKGLRNCIRGTSNLGIIGHLLSLESLKNIGVLSLHIRILMLGQIIG